MRKKQVRYFCGRIVVVWGGKLVVWGGLGCFGVVWGVSTDRLPYNAERQAR